MTNLSNRFLKGKTVYVVEMKSYSTTKELIREHPILKRDGLFLTNSISVYHSEREARAAIQTEINRIKYDPMNVDIEIFYDKNLAVIRFSMEIQNTVISSFNVEMRLIEQEIE